MFTKHIKAVSLVLALCLIAVMFLLVALFNKNIDAASPISSAVLLLFVVAAGIPVFAAHQKHN